MSQEKSNFEGDSDVVPEENDIEQSSSSGDEGNSILMKQISEMQSAIELAKNEHMRALADLDNMRRRMVREKEELRRTASSGVIESLLPVMDNMILGLEAAERHSVEGSEDIVKGFNMVLEQMKNVLQDHGAKMLNPEGEVFDPNLHESVALMPSDDVEESKIIEVVRVGYTLNDRLLRPASVVVSSGIKQEEK